MPTMVHASRDEVGFNLNQVGDNVLLTNVDADWVRFQVSPESGGTFGSAEVALLGSLDPTGVQISQFIELDEHGRLTDFGISRLFNVTGIPSLRVQVVVNHGSAATPCKVRVSYVSRSVS